MKRYIHICDKCKKKADIDKVGDPDGWVDAGVTCGTYSQVRTLARFYLCPECAQKVGIPVSNDTPKEEMVSAGDQLYDMITEIVDERMQEEIRTQ